MAGASDLYSLLVTTNEERDFFHSGIFVYRGFPGPEPESLLAMPEWIVDFTVMADGSIVAVTGDGKTLIHGATTGPLEKRSDAPFFAVSADPQRRTALAVGWSGAAHVYESGAWRDLGAPGPEDLLAAAIGTDGTLWAGGRHGALYRCVGGAWAKIDLETNAAIEAIACAPGNAVLAGGTSGALFLAQDGKTFEALDSAPGDVKGAFFHRGAFVVDGPGFSFSKLEGTAVVPFKTGRAPYKSTVHGDWILSAEDDAILYFTGEGWFRMPVR